MVASSKVAPPRAAKFPLNLSSTRSKNYWLASLLLAIFLAAAASAPAGVVYSVTTLTDSTNPAPACVSASTICSLRDAVGLVNAGSGGDVIEIGVVGTITLTNGTLTINQGVTISGAGANLVTLSGNNAVPVFTVTTPGTVNISGLTIAHGSSSNTVNGGGISHIYAGTWTVSNCTFYDNSTTAGEGGGAIANGGTLTVENSTFVGNSAPNGAGGGPGGAIFNNGGTLTVENSTFFGNSAAGPGAGIFNNGSVTLLNTTITGNTGDGVWNNGGGGNTVTLTNSIVAGNSAGDCDNCGTQSANNLIGGAPSLSPLQYNGGPTETMMPLPGGAAIIGAGSSSTLATDQRGFGRATGSGGVSDLGAVQTHYMTVTTLADSNDPSATCTAGESCSLFDAITLGNSTGSADVRFASGLTGTIDTSVNGLPQIGGFLNLQGPGPNVLTVSGAVEISSGGNVNLSGLTIAHSSSNPGLFNNGAALTLSNCSISNNSALSSTGGGIYTNASSVVMDHCSVSGNSAGYNGGGIFNDGAAFMIRASTISGNSAGGGGGIHNAGRMALENSTVAGNTASSDGASGNTTAGGAGIYTSDVLEVLDSTISGNTSASDGGGIYVGSGAYPVSFNYLTLINSIVAGNTTAPAPEDDCANCGTQNAANLMSTSSAPIAAAQLMLGPLAYNGPNQTVQTLLPLPGSPVIQAGNPALLPIDMTTDERGRPRTLNGKLDLGAVETNYTSVQFVQQPMDGFVNLALAPAVTLSVTESGAAAQNVPVPLTFSGSGTLSGTLTETTAAPQNGGAAVATFGDLKVSAAGTGDTLATSLTVTPAGMTPAQTLTATSNPFTVAAPGFTLSASPASITLRQGQTGMATFTVTPQDNYNGPVSLSCSGLPSYATCTFTPASVTLDGTGKAMTAQLTITTQGPNTGSVAENRGGAPLHPASNPVLAAIFWLPGLLLGGFLGLERKRVRMGMQQTLLLILVVGLIGVMGGLNGCGGSSKSTGGTPTPPSTPAGSYTVTITATATGAASQNATFALTVTQ